ncbi:MAG: hypothetical protein JWR89_5038 [Tardiphaga sp.]|jgi:hypothetical protein|uniref:hypothetical protein n=1 Tax=Tardiphaga sp. TaxID=1926292 RepID=UPI002629B68C|nr:hypothetical protein [Tardiphaga sp.]MDB5505136.1 hypothetical protein [Tardiphaga sp.]
MTAQPYPRVTALIDQFGALLKRWHERSEMNELDAGEFNRIASEMGLSSADLESVVRQGKHAADELPMLLRALGFDDAAIARIERPVLNDMQRTCANCQHKPACQQDLVAGVAEKHYESYCANADTIGALTKAAQ